MPKEREKIHAQLEPLAVEVSTLVPDPHNARKHDARNVDAIAESLREHGQRKPVVAQKVGDTLVVRAGNGTLQAAKKLGWKRLAVLVVEEDDREATRFALRDNRTAELAEWDDEALRRALQECAESEAEIAALGWNPDEFQAEEESEGEAKSAVRREAGVKLAEQFLVPPFSVLDARQGPWNERKATWNLLGVQSSSGRSEDLLMPSLTGRVTTYYPQKRKVEAKLGRALTNAEFEANHLVMPEGQSYQATGTSVFDPVLAEVLVTWFSPVGGRVLDPFAGGSVRGVVSGWLGRSYVGVDLREEQVQENRAQAAQIFSLSEPTTPEVVEESISDPSALTPVESVSLPDRSVAWIKRDDLFEVNGVTGAKARAGLLFGKGAAGLVAVGSRHSSMVSRVARLAETLGIPSRVYTSDSKDLSPSEADAVAHGAELIKPPGRGFMTRLQKIAREDHTGRPGWRYVELGLESQEYNEANVSQIDNLPAEAKRIVCAVGSGTGLASILHGLDRIGRSDVRVLGVKVSTLDSESVLDRRAPSGWRDRVDFVESDLPYEQSVPDASFGPFPVDAMYEAKCLPFLQGGDVLWSFARAKTYAGVRSTGSGASGTTPRWIVGDAQDVASLAADGAPYDFVLTCPPYADLEVYSDDPRDLSTMDYPEFIAAYTKAIAGAASLLAPDRFFAIVVGEVREKKGGGAYRGFVPDTIRACEAAGLRYYNEIVLLTPAGTVPIRARRFFESGRKVGKIHQNVLVFVKGDPQKATGACGPVKVADMEEGA